MHSTFSTKISSSKTELCFSLAYRAGVTTGITAPMHAGFVSGVGTRFSLDSEHRLAGGATVTDGGVHVDIGHGSVSISTQVAALRHALLNAIDGEGKGGDASEWFGAVVNVSILRYPILSSVLTHNVP